jgi:hypothetical protein
MNTEYAVGGFRIHFESRARRRWFVVLFYALLAALDVTGFSVPNRAWLSQHAGAEWMVSGCLVLVVALMLVFTYVAGDMRTRGDEREAHRRDHAHYVAYRILLYSVVAALSCAVIAAFFASYFGGRNPITPSLPPALRGVLIQQPRFLLIAACILFFTLPQAILLWTEPDMEKAR